MNSLTHDFLAYGEESSRVAAWADRAYGALIGLIDAGKLDQFMVEDVRDQLEPIAGKPDDGRWWGIVGSRLSREKRVELIGYFKSQQPQAHKRPTALWRVL